MTEAYHKPRLPQVTPDDLAQILFEDITDPSHIVRWIDFAETNPVLARDILERAYIDIHKSATDPDRVKVAIDLVSYAVRALEVAQLRQPSGDGGDADLQPSA